MFNIDKQREWLKHVGVGDVWGIGRQWHKKLMEQGIYTAYDLAQKNAHALKAQFNVVLMRTIMELQGRPCAGLLVEDLKQSIMSSKSFGGMQTDLELIAEAISSHCARAWEKLRRQGLVAQSLFVFVQTNSFRKDLPQYCKSMQFKLINPSDYLSLLTKVAKRCLKKLYRAGYQYKKVGVCLEDLIPKNPRQLDIFHQLSDECLTRQEKVMNVMEGINQKYDRHSIHLAAEGNAKPWAMRAELKSPAYTTRWSDLPLVKA